MAQYTHDIVATTGEYTDRQTGASKKQYTNVGKAFTDDQGRISLKLTTIPVGPDWSGWLSLYPANKEQQRPAPAHRQPPERQRHEQAKADGFAPEHFDDGDNPPF
jgi:hypothetical protein